MMQSSVWDGRQPYAIVIGLDSMQGIQAARILARRGVPVIAIAEDPRHHCCRTKICQQILFANTGNEELIRTLETLGPKLGQKAVLFPCEDANVLLVSRHRHRLEEWYHVVLPASDVVEMMMDKVRFYTYAQEEGFPIPRTFVLASRADAEQAARQLTFPCILKPPHRSQGWAQHTKLKAFKASGVEELLALYDRYKQWADALIAQEWIEGTDANLYSCNCYFDADSRPIVTFIARKLRQWPPETGQSCLGVECRDDAVLHESIRLFRSVRYRGLGYVEMKRDERSGKYFIMEPNIGRPTGRSAIAEAGGVELLYTMYCDAVGRPLPDSREQKYGEVKWIHLRRDFQSALHYWRQGKLTPMEWWQSIQGRKAYALFSWSDPVPFLYDLYSGIQVFLSPQDRRKRDHRDPLCKGN
jgi:D-aspartate ligase